MDDISIWIGKLHKANGPAKYKWPSCNPFKDLDKTRNRRREDLFSSSLPELGHQSSHAPGWDLHHRLPWFPGLWTQTGNTPPAWVGLQFADWRMWDVSASIIVWDSSPYRINIYIYQLIDPYSNILPFNTSKPWMSQSIVLKHLSIIA